LTHCHTQMPSRSPCIISVDRKTLWGTLGPELQQKFPKNGTFGSQIFTMVLLTKTCLYKNGYPSTLHERKLWVCLTCVDGREKAQTMCSMHSMWNPLSHWPSLSVQLLCLCSLVLLGTLDSQK
jgi:hypothetical protein